MRLQQLGFFTVFALIVGLLLVTINVQVEPSFASPVAEATPSGHTATAEELAQAAAEWSHSSHADTYDGGMGANTTCARCKSPRNWDPTKDLAAQAALDCGACKRVPGEPRPELLEGERVPIQAWKDIGCEICHIPVGDSFDIGIAFWDQATRSYQAVENVTALCAHCHEGQHGFQVVEEQIASDVHATMRCTDCHGAHGESSSCQDCHEPEVGGGAAEHLRHPSVNCTACHDAGRLSLWHDTDPGSPHYGEYVTRRFAHTLTSWPSHNLSREVECERCHHPLSNKAAALVPYVGCDECHDHSHGAVSEWCIYFPRDRDPNANVPDE